MIPLVVSPYSFRGSVVRFDDLIERLNYLGLESVVLADLNFHSAVAFNESMRKNGKIPVHALLKGRKVFIALNREGYDSLVLFHNGISKNLRSVLVKDISSFKVVMYLSRDQRKVFEAMRRILGLKPLEGDFSMEGKLMDPLKVFKVEPYSLEVNQVFREPPEGWPDSDFQDRIYRERLERELDLVERMGFRGYFHAVERIVKKARELNVKTGPGRGSSVGSLLVYSLGITKVDPMEYGLLFERFLNEGRKEMPDVDLDVEDGARKELIKSLKDEFEFVGLISTFSTLKERSLKRIARDLEIDEEVLKHLEGLPVRRSVHAAGIVVSDEDMILPIIPGDVPVIEYDMNSLKSIGVEKIDVLGLRTLSFLKELEDLTGLRCEDLPMKEEVFESISDGLTNGVFQLESLEARRISRYVMPSSMSELSHVLALNRPGPLKMGAHREYLKNRLEGFRKTREIDEILSETMGLPIYQEQIMMMVSKLAGFTLEESDDIRRAISKKDKTLMRRILPELERRLLERYDPAFAEETLELIEKFASYAFNKSHSVAYAHLSYWIAYFKEYEFPTFFFHYLRWNRSNFEKCFRLVHEARYRGYRVKNPSVNEPDGSSNGKELILPLWLVKGVDSNALNRVREMVPIERLSDLRGIPQPVLENMIKAGALDGIYGSRREALEMLRRGEGARILDRLKSKMGVTGRVEKVEDETDRVLMESEALGFPVSLIDFESTLPKISEVFARGMSRAVHVLVRGRILSDGVSTFVLKRNIGDGDKMVVLNPKGFVESSVRTGELSEIVYELDLDLENVEPVLERASDVEFVKTKRNFLKGVRPRIDSRIVLVI